MKRLFLVVAVVFVAVSFAVAQTSEQKLSSGELKIKQELTKLEEEWHNAYLKRDAESLERILADEYITVGSSNGSGDKAQAIAGLKADTSTYEYSTPYDLDFRFYGNTVIIIGHTKERENLRTEPSSSANIAGRIFL